MGWYAKSLHFCLPHYLLLTTGLRHTPAPLPKKKKSGVWVFPYQRLTNTNGNFGTDQYFYLVRPLGGGKDKC